MQYALIPWPYLNSRYDASVRPMLMKELARLLERAGVDARTYEARFAGQDFLCFESDLLPERALELLGTHSHLRLLFKVLEGGALMPLELLRGYKGYGLALLVDIFAGVLAGAGFGERVLGPAVSGAANTGHFFAALRIDAFRDPADFAADMNTLLGALRDSPKAAGEERIYIHGEKEFEKADRALVEGVALSEVAVKSLIQAGKQAGIPFDLVPLRID